MCGFMVYRDGLTPNKEFVRRRGPDRVHEVRAHGFTFVHYLLHVTGEPTPQPFVDGDIYCVYNGEIYNCPYSRSDGEVIIPLYREHGPSFAEHLDGEFAIALYDFEKGIYVFCTDAFGTKPLWVNGLNVASYHSCLGGHELSPNTIMVNSINGKHETSPVVRFDFNHQHKDSYDDWITAFEAAIRKRAYPNSFIGLSSGYDSGAIACELSRQAIDFAVYGVEGSEDVTMLRTRLERHGGKLLTCSQEEYESLKKKIKTIAEEYDYSTVPGGPIHCSEMTNDWGAVGSALLFEQATFDRRRVCLSGQGADEILSDYSLYPDVSTLHGIFPEKMRPWPNFQGGCQRAYLRKEEHIAGAYGVEARYPFLDLKLVQEFLWLDNRLKNRTYKAPLDHYLRRHGYPFVEHQKIGFSAI